MTKRIVLMVTELVAGIAALVAFFIPLGTVFQILLFAAAIVVLILCIGSNRKLKRESTGYWPDKSDFWN
jgi:hypothetical protein